MEDYTNNEAAPVEGSEEQKEPEVIMECGLDYSLSENDGCRIAEGEARIELYEENIIIIPKYGQPLEISYRDMSEFAASNYRINILLDSTERLVLSSIGYHYEDLVKNLLRLRSEMLIKDMLMDEGIIKPGVEAEYVLYGENETVIAGGGCEVRLYDTAVIIIPEGRDPERLPYCIIAEVNPGDYDIWFVLEDGKRYRLYAMGTELDPFKKCLSDAVNSIASKTQSILKGFLPETSLSVIRRVSKFMVEGKAAKRSDIESVSPELWSDMEERLKSSGVFDGYEFLKSLSQKDKMCIGIKKGLMGSLTGEYIWFLVPLYSTDPKQPGNAVIMEASSGEGGAMATYIFRMMDKNRYYSGLSMEELSCEADSFIRRLNYCMLSVNFRREPIYLSDQKLKDPKYISYKIAVKKLEPLRILRSLYIGRVIHSSHDKWRQDIMELLKSNMES